MHQKQEAIGQSHRAFGGKRLITKETGDRLAKTHFVALDGQRGIAALMVLLGHASTLMLGQAHGFVPRKTLAVVFFFMLSGFVVASAYEARIRAGMSFREFVARRAIRLYPLIVLGTAIGSAWFALFDPLFWANHRWISAVLAGPLGLPSLKTAFSFGYFPLNPPQWSLFFELLAYVAFALVLAKASTRSLVWATAALAVGYAASDYRYFNKIPIYLAEFEAGASFCGGLLLWRFYQSCRLPDWRVTSWVPAVAIIAVCACPLKLTPLIDYAALTLLFPAVLLLGAARGRGAASRLERLLGELSYPVYILHWPFLLAAHRFIQPELGAGPAIAIGVISAIVFSWLALRAYDEPLRSLLSEAFLLRSRRKNSDENAVDSLPFTCSVVRSAIRPA